MRYYLSVEQTDLRERRARWKAQKQIRAEPRVQEFGTAQAATDPPGGLVALVDDSGQVERSARPRQGRNCGTARTIGPKGHRGDGLS
jgi:hypothetical protein